MNAKATTIAPFAALLACAALAATFATTFAAPAHAAVGQPAPAFSATNSNGGTVTLADQRGKVVVLEWTNPACPFVEKYYSSGAMQGMQDEARKKGVVWLTINSTGPGKPGNQSGGDANNALRSNRATPTAYLIDQNGAIGRAYGARTTPLMVIIGKDGTIAYEGGIDDAPSADPADIARARPLFKQALESIEQGAKPAVATARAYGCSIHY